MAVSKPLSREYRIYLALWRKAYRERTGRQELQIHASSFSTALSMRQGMYRAIRPFRDGSQFDEELRAAAEAFVVAVPKLDDPKSPHTLTLKPRLTLSELESELHNLGLDEEDLLLLEEKLAIKQLDDFAAQKPEPRPSNPFYTRED